MDTRQGARRMKNKDVFHPKCTERTDLGAIIVAPGKISGLDAIAAIPIRQKLYFCQFTLLMAAINQFRAPEYLVPSQPPFRLP
ncbi:hypothetical protein [Microbulbifer litoralis]|uniref:hypothetical protein n=1 Tax=Microbulbifer litoralis TaxID=2933965 RepID=UPI0020288257|nr:hypothetical protein [Microbulbifer sp. GX H0434]